MNSSLIQPYLFFAGRCEEALDHYRTILGAEVEMLMRFSEAPDQPPPGTLEAGFENKVMHSSFRIGSSTLMASDGCESGTGFEGFALSLTATDADQARQYFDGLAQDGQITMPLNETFWSPCFGMVKDRFGVLWMITVPS
ncbi:MAG: VOC family protein [Verrucomicrobiae bacterium]|nr:VOC family protein [Verrucomicrobiae bacterium]MCB1088835.1 VOC family protein [Verrucomicrobiae bacterium]MCB1090273.1 VOC family protein [Verrucomicrobiae bacterium]